MQLRYLENVILKKATKITQTNGVKMNTYEEIKTYKIQKQDIEDEISATIYGADINEMIRISSIRYELEQYLETKNNNTGDNVSKYYIFYKGFIYKIVSVKEHWIDMRRI